MGPTDDGRHIPAIYGEFVEVFTNGMVETLPPLRSTDHAIDLEPDYNLPYGWIYNLLDFELRMLQAYIKANLANRFIQRSSSPILYAKKTHGGVRLCVDYHALNKATVKNWHPLRLISEMFYRVRETRIFRKLDVGGVYNLILDQGRRWIPNGFLNALWPMWIPGHPSWSDTCTGYLPVLHRWFPIAIHWWHQRIPCRWHTHPFGQSELARGTCAPSTAATDGIGSRMQSREVSIRSVRSRLPVGFITPDWVGIDSGGISPMVAWPTTKSVRDV